MSRLVIQSSPKRWPEDPFWLKFDSSIIYYDSNQSFRWRMDAQNRIFKASLLSAIKHFTKNAPRFLVIFHQKMQSSHGSSTHRHFSCIGILLKLFSPFQNMLSFILKWDTCLIFFQNIFAACVQAIVWQRRRLHSARYKQRSRHSAR